MQEYDAAQKLDILKTFLQELHHSRRHFATFENRVAVSFATAFLLFAGFVLKGEHVFSAGETRTVLSLIALVTILGVWFLLRNDALLRVICRMIVRIEQILHLHTDGYFITTEDVKLLGNIPYPEPSVVPKEVHNWGMTRKWQAVTPHIAVVCFSGVASGLVVLFS